MALSALVRAKITFDSQVEKLTSDPSLSEKEQHFLIIELLASVAKTAKAGNCQEMAALAFLFLMKQEIFPIEIVNNHEHTFVVIGRDPNTDIKKINEWNEDVVICDPWKKAKTQLQADRFFHHYESMCFSPDRLLEQLPNKGENLAVGFSMSQRPLKSLAIFSGILL